VNRRTISAAAFAVSDFPVDGHGAPGDSGKRRNLKPSHTLLTAPMSSMASFFSPIAVPTSGYVAVMAIIVDCFEATRTGARSAPAACRCPKKLHK
jgi:hypothetical protein